MLFISSGLARHEGVIDSVVTGGGPRGEEDKEAKKRFLFIKVEVAGGCLMRFGCGGQEVGDTLRFSEGWSKGIHSTQRGVGWPNSGAWMAHLHLAEAHSGAEVGRETSTRVTGPRFCS